MTLEREWINQLQSLWPQVDLRHDTFYDSVSRQILTTDMLVENVHFSWDYFKPQDLGWRSIAINLSDIAATGGTALWVLVSIGVPEEKSIEQLKSIYKGIDECCKRYNCKVVGGDTVRSAVTTVSVTVLGTLSERSIPGRRSFAKPGDIIAASGPHGLSRAGLEVLRKGIDGFQRAKEAHLRPIPQLRLGQQIAQVIPRFALTDSSDGLADAVLRIAEASKVDVIINRKWLTIDPEVEEIALHTGADPLDWVLYGGEDFHLVVSLPPETLALFPQLHPIGYVEKLSYPKEGRVFLLDHNRDLTLLDPQKTFQHFNFYDNLIQGRREAFSL